LAGSPEKDTRIPPQAASEFRAGGASSAWLSPDFERDAAIPKLQNQRFVVKLPVETVIEGEYMGNIAISSYVKMPVDLFEKKLTANINGRK
jgi:hypothetical protein